MGTRWNSLDGLGEGGAIEDGAVDEAGASGVSLDERGDEAGIGVREVVDDLDGCSAVEQAFGEVAADEARAPVTQTVRPR